MIRAPSCDACSMACLASVIDSEGVAGNLIFASADSKTVHEFPTRSAIELWPANVILVGRRAPVHQERDRTRRALSNMKRDDASVWHIRAALHVYLTIVAFESRRRLRWDLVLPVRKAKVATAAVSSAGSTGLATCVWKPARKPRCLITSSRSPPDVCGRRSHAGDAEDCNRFGGADTTAPREPWRFFGYSASFWNAIRYHSHARNRSIFGGRG